MKLGWNESYYQFTKDEVTGYAPSSPGLYALFTQDQKTCLRVKASPENDLRQTLSKLASPTLPPEFPDKILSRAKWYQFEVVPPSQIPARSLEAVAELRPLEW